MSGWIKLYRDIKYHWIWNDSTYLKAWITIILTVNHEDCKVLIAGELIECKRGQSLFSLSTWAKTFGKHWSIQKVRTFLKLLSNDKMITFEGLHKTTRLTVCNYELYQNNQQTDNTQITDKKQADNNEITTNNKNKEIKEEKKDKNNTKDFDLNFIDPKFLESFQSWIDYKKAKKQYYKNQQSFEACYRNLLKLSNNDPKIAYELVEWNMAQNYSGLFPLKINSQPKKEFDSKNVNSNWR